MSLSSPTFAAGSTIVGLRYHRQNKTDFCGAAVAQMLLRPFEHALRDQMQLAAQNGMNSGGVADAKASAAGLVKTLNDTKLSVQFASAEPGEPYIFAAAALRTTRSGVAARIYGIDHWVALNGSVLDPGSGSQPRGFYIHDPYPDDLQPLTAHSDNDPCGRGGSNGSANAYLTVRGMSYFVGPPTALVFATKEVKEIFTVGTPPPIERARTPTVAGAMIQVGHEACDRAAAGIVAEGVDDQPLLGALLAGFQALPGQPCNNDYWQVPLEVSGRLAGYAFVARDNGELLRVTATASASELPLMDLSKMWVLFDELHANEALIDNIDPGFMPALKSRPEAVQASFFWRLCREAPSPNRPLIRIRAGGRMLYRSHDGAFHVELHVLD